MESRKFLVVILLMMLTIFYFPEAFFYDNILSFRDLSRYFYPLRLFTVNSVKSGILPLWNPYMSCGVPHLALQQSAIFYPVSIIYYIMPFYKAFNVFLVFHVFLIGLFTYLLGHRWGFREASSIASAITIMFCGYTISLLNLTSTLGSVVWLPLILLFFDMALSGKGLKYIFLSAITLSMMFLGGEPSIFYATLWVLLFYALFFWAGHVRSLGSFKNIFLKLAIAISLGVMLSSVQLVPFMELSKFADRTTQAAPFEFLTKWSLHIRDTFSFIIPFFARTDFSKDSYWKEQNWAILIYIGTLSIILVFLSLLMRKNWRVKFLYFVSILALMVSYGGNTPLYYLVYKFIPGFHFIRYPARFLFITTFGLSLLAGFGLEAYFNMKEKKIRVSEKSFKVSASFLCMLALLFLILSVYGSSIFNSVYRFWTNNTQWNNDVSFIVSFIVGMKNMQRLVGFVVVGSLVLFLGLRFELKKWIAPALFIAIMSADFFSVTPITQAMLDRSFFDSPGVNMGLLQKDRTLFRVFSSPKARDTKNFPDQKRYEDAVALQKDRLCSNWPMVFGLYDAYGYDSIYLSDYTKLSTLVATMSSPSDTRVLDMLNVKYVAVLERIEADGYRPVNETAPYLYENIKAMPRAFIVNSFVLLKKEEDIAEKLRSKEFDPAGEVILEEPPKIKVKPVGCDPDENFTDKAEIVKYSPNEVLIRAIVSAPKFLVLSDSYYPGWLVYVDGIKDKIYKANFVSRAVYLDKGSHLVRFVFDPYSFRLGAGISILTLLGMALFYIVRRRI